MQNNSKSVSSVKWLIEKSKSEHWKMCVLIILNAFLSVLSVAFAFAVKMIIDGATSGIKDEIIGGSIFIGAIVLFQFLGRIAVNGLSEHIVARLEIVYKSYIFSEVLKKKYDKINVYHSGEILNRIISDVSIVSSNMATILPVIVASVVRLVCAVIALVVLDWVFAVAFVVAGLLVFLVVGVLKGKLKSLHKLSRETDGKVRSFMQESVENILALKVFSVNEKVEKIADDLQDENFKIKMQRKNYSVLGHATYNLIFSGGYIFALIYGAFKILADTTGVFTYGSLSAILQLVNNVQVPFASLSSVFSNYYAMTASAERLIEIEQIENEPPIEYLNAEKVYSETDSIKVENVKFAYDRDTVLDDVNLTINKGDFVAITGISGIGKSTLLKLLLGVYNPIHGELYFEGKNGKTEIGNSTRKVFSYVPQGNMLFSGTLYDNVTFIKSDATEEEINKALEISCASEFIKALPEGLNTKVGENGVGLSEGQIQRIAIARALLTESPIILMDEATSALDEQTEEKLLCNLKALKDVTLIIVSHKRAALDICNRRIAIENKKIVEK